MRNLIIDNLIIVCLIGLFIIYVIKKKNENFIEIKKGVKVKRKFELENGTFTLYKNSDFKKRQFKLEGKEYKNPLVNRPKIVVLILLIGDKYKQYVDISVNRKIKYCIMHEYDLIICNKNLIKEKNTHLVWSKIPFILKFIKNYDWVFCSDADTLINLHTMKLELFIKENKGKHLLINEDDVWDFWKKKEFNLFLKPQITKQMYKKSPFVTTSDFLIKNSSWSINLLKECMFLKNKMNKNVFNDKYSEFFFKDLQEQSYLNYLILKNKENYDKTRIYLDGNRFSSAFRTFGEVPYFLIDFQGIRGPLLKEVLEILDKYQRNPKYEIDGIDRKLIAFHTFQKSNYCRNFKKIMKKNKFESSNLWRFGNTRNYHQNFLYPMWCRNLDPKNKLSNLLKNKEINLTVLYNYLHGNNRTEGYKNISPSTLVNEKKDYIFYKNYKGVGPKILMIMILVGDDYIKYVFPCVKTKINYCKLHNYDLIISRKSLEPSRHLSWSKIPLILKHLDKYDWIYATDADTYINIPSKKIEEVLDTKHKLFLNSENDANPEWSRGLTYIFNKKHEKKIINKVPLICCSEFIIKGKNAWSNRFLNKIYNINYDSLKQYYLKKIYEVYFVNLMEQGSINYYLMINRNDFNNTKIFNNKTNFADQFLFHTKKSFIIDFQGIRGELLKELVEIVSNKDHKLHKKNGIKIMLNMKDSKYCKNRKNPRYKPKYDKKDDWYFGDNEKYDKHMQHPSFCTMYYVSPKAAAKLVRSTIPFLKNVQRDKLKEKKRRFMVIIPMNGLTDRIGVILSWKVIADKLNKDFYVYWTPSPQFSANHWNELFQNKLNIKFITKKQLENLKQYKHTYIEKKSNVNEWRNMYKKVPLQDTIFKIYLKVKKGGELSAYDKNIITQYNGKNNFMKYVKTYSNKSTKILEGNVIYKGYMSILREPKIRFQMYVQYNSKSYKNYVNIMKKNLKLVQPIVKLQKKIDNYINKNFNKNTIGVHIRRGDLFYFIKQFGGIKLMSDKNYINSINKEIKSNPQTRIFLATDSIKTLNKFKKLYPKRLLHFYGKEKRYFDINTNILKGTNNKIIKNLSKAAKTNQEFAVIDLFILAKTKKIIGEGQSGFSNIASEIGNIKLITNSEKQKMFFD